MNLLCPECNGDKIIIESLTKTFNLKCKQCDHVWSRNEVGFEYFPKNYEIKITK